MTTSNVQGQRHESVKTNDEYGATLYKQYEGKEDTLPALVEELLHIITHVPSPVKEEMFVERCVKQVLVKAA